MHPGSSPGVRTNKKKTPPIGGVFFLLAQIARRRTPAARRTLKFAIGLEAAEKKVGFCKAK